MCIIMNHMVCDGAGFKEYLYLLSEIYTRIQNNTYSDFRYINGSRSLKQIYKKFNLIDRLKIHRLPSELTEDQNKTCFPLNGEPTGKHPFILTYKLSENRFNMLKKYGQDRSVTINDIVLAAYIRALYKILNIKKSESLTIPCFIDLRRYLPDKKAQGICNLTSIVTCNMGYDIGDNFDETVRKVNAEMNKKKDYYPGLNRLPTLCLLFKTLPFYRIKDIIKSNYVNPLIGMTNIGIIDPERLIFGKTPIEDALITGSIKYPPYFQLALTTFNNSITFSVNLYGSKDDAGLIQKFFILLDDELPI
jgi:NRPS condensation-like uncharacterized protein